MKNIYENNITDITVDSENPNFPIERVFDEHPKRIYKAVDDVQSVTMEISVIGGFDAIAFAGTNIDSVSMIAENPTTMEWADGDEWASGETWGSVDIDVFVKLRQSSTSGALWGDLVTPVLSPTIITATCSTSEATLYCGVVRANTSNDFSDILGLPIDPRYGVQESRVDYSIIDENSNGSEYYNKRDIVRTFGISILMSRSAFYDLMESYDLNGKKPTAWKVTDLDSNQWVVFAKFDGQPVGSFDYYNYVNATFTLTEVI